MKKWNRKWWFVIPGGYILFLVGHSMAEDLAGFFVRGDDSRYMALTSSLPWNGGFAVPLCDRRSQEKNGMGDTLACSACGAMHRAVMSLNLGVAKTEARIKLADSGFWNAHHTSEHSSEIDFDLEYRFALDRNRMSPRPAHMYIDGKTTVTSDGTQEEIKFQKCEEIQFSSNGIDRTCTLIFRRAASGRIVARQNETQLLGLIEYTYED